MPLGKINRDHHRLPPLRSALRPRIKKATLDRLFSLIPIGPIYHSSTGENLDPGQIFCIFQVKFFPEWFQPHLPLDRRRAFSNFLCGNNHPPLHPLVFCMLSCGKIPRWNVPASGVAFGPPGAIGFTPSHKPIPTVSRACPLLNPP